MFRYILLGFLLSTAPAAMAIPGITDYSTVESVDVREVPDHGINIFVNNDCDRQPTMDLDWSDVVNIGAQVWKIVEANVPVVSLDLPVAHAMPRGLKCWNDLEQWQAPRTRSYEVLYKNKLGMEVVKFRYRLHYTYGGSHKGQGRYLTNVTVMEGDLSVAWGYTFNARADVLRAVNLGTEQNPVGGLEINLHWTASTWARENRASVHFFVDGNGEVRFAN